MAVHSSVVDFSLTSADHSRLPVMVVPLGELNAPLFSSMMEALGSCPTFQVADVKGQNFVSFKFLTSTTLPRWAQGRVDWSEFAAHKQILGVIAVCQCMDEEEFQDMAARFKTTCNANAGVCDSRCLVFGPEQALCHLIDIRKGFVLIDVAQEQVADTEAVDVWMVHRVLSDYAVTMHAQLCARLKEFGRSFGLIERKVVSERQLYSPLEKERKPLSRNHRKARALKHLGDLHQLAGQSTEAVARYTRAASLLRSRNDYLWLAAALEGSACAADLHRRGEELLSTPNLGRADAESCSYLKARSLSRRRAGKLHTESPVMDHRHTSPAPPLPNRGTPQGVEEVRIDMSGSPLASPLLKRFTADPFEDTMTISPGESMSTIASDELAGMEGGSNGVFFGEETRMGSPVSVVFREDGATPGDGSEGEEEESGVFEEEVDGGKVWLDRDYTTSRYHEALYYYVKAGKDGGIPFVEALLKFAKFLAEAKSYERANEALHRLYQHKFLLYAEDQVTLIQMIASVYRSIKFNRNAAMYTCLAADHAMDVARTTSTSQLHYFTAYHLLMDSLSGYQMSLEPEDTQEIGQHCWPQIQARLLFKLLFLTNTLQQNSLVVRHASFLLQYLYTHLSEADLQKVTELLHSAALEREAGQEDRMLPYISMATQDKPIALSKIPTVQSFVPLPLNEAQKPHRHHGYTPPPSPDTLNSPFIFSSLQYNKTKKIVKEIWVSETPVEVYVEIANPLPFQIQVEDIRLWAESTTVALDTTRTSLTLPPSGEPQQLTLYVIPHGTGVVQVHGYRAQVFGVKSMCRVTRSGSRPTFTVLPTLPNLRVRPKLLPPPTLGSLTPDQILQLPDLQEPVCLLDGEGSTLALMLDTSREAHVTQLSLTLVSPPSQRCSLSWREEELHSVLPLAPHSRCYILLKVTAHYPPNTRVLPDDSEVDEGDPGGGYHSTVTLDPRRRSYDGSSHSLKPPPITGPFSRVTRLIDRFRSGSSSRSKTLQSAKSYTLVAKQQFPSHSPPISRRFKTLPRPTLQQSASVMSLRSHTRDMSTGRRCITPSGSTDGSDEADYVASVDSVGRSSTSPQGTAYPDPRQRRAVAIATDLGSLLGASLALPGRQTYEAQYVAEYTGGLGAEEGYYRKLDFAVSVQSQPSFVFGQFRVEPGSSDDQFVLVFSALNCSSYTLQLLLSVDEDMWMGDDGDHVLSWEFEARAGRSIAIPLKKFNVEERGAGESLNPELYTERITSCIQLRWQNRSLGRQGTTSLKGFALQPPALTLVRPQQVTFSLLVNGRQFGGGSLVRLELGRKAVVQLTVTNTSGSLLSQGVVQLMLWQEVEGRVVDRRLKGKVIHSSSLNMQVPWLAPKEKFSLHTTLMFVCAGEYQLQPVCCVPRATASPPTGGVAVQEWARLLGVVGNLPDDDVILQMLTETMSDLIDGTSSEVHSKRHSHRSHSSDCSRPIPMRKRIDLWKQLSGDKDTPPSNRRHHLSSSGTPPTGGVADGPLPMLASTNEVDETLSCLHGDSTVPQLSELLSVQQKGGSTVEVKPTLSVSPNSGNQATSLTQMTDVYGPNTVSMATPRTGVPLADRSVSVCAGPKVGVAVALLPQHTTSI